MDNQQKISGKVMAAVFATGIMSFCGVLVETAMNITFPTLMQEFNIPTNLVQWMTTIYLLVVSIIVPISALLKRRYRTKSLFIVANLLFILGVVIDAFSPIFPLLLVGRAIQGIGTGIALPLMFNIILEQVPTSKVGFMMGIGAMITGIAPAIGPTFGGVIVNTLGWRWIFAFLLPILLFSLLLGIWGIQQKSAISKVHIDILAMLGITIFFSGLIYGLSNLSSGHFLSLSVGGAILIGLLGFVWFSYRNHQIATPILALHLFRNSNFAGHILAFFLIQFLSLGNAFLLPNYIQLVNGNSAMVAGLIVLPAGVIGAIMSPIGGKILDAAGARKPLITGTSLMLLANLLMAVNAMHLNTVYIILVYAVYMGAMGMTMGNTMTDTLSVIDKKDSPQGNAILNTVQQFAGAVGTSITSAIVAFSQQAQHSKGALPTALGTRNAYWILVVAAIVLLFLMIKYASHPKNQVNE